MTGAQLSLFGPPPVPSCTPPTPAGKHRDQSHSRLDHSLTGLGYVAWISHGGQVCVERRRLACVADDMTEHAYQELASALESPPRIAGKTAGFDQPGREYTAGDALGLRRDR